MTANRPLVIDPDLIHLFLALGETSCNSVAIAIIIQRVAHLATRTKKLNMTTQELLAQFPFMGERSMKRNIHTLRKYKIWKNKKYLPSTGMASYSDIKISWRAVAQQAEKVLEQQTQENELKIMCRRLSARG